MLRIASGILVTLGLVGGTFFNSAGDISPAERGEYKVVAADFHVHSFFGDGVLSPFNLPMQAQRQGLHALAITNHNQVFSAKLGRWFSNLVGGPTVLVGQEITAPGYHIIGVGLNKTVEWRQPVEGAINEVHLQGGVAIAAHPVAKYWQTFDEDVVQKLDGTEVMHLMVYNPEDKWQEIRDFYRKVESTGQRITAIGSSDHHWFNWLGMCRTYVFVKENTEDEIINALRAGRTVVYDLDGKAYGDSTMIKLLQEKPIKRTGNYNYGHAGIIDLVTRTGGWFGLLGLVLFGRRKRG